jgi:hypothetical protein
VARIALFITTKAKAGKGDEVRNLWDRQLRAHVEQDEAQEFYAYLFR